MRYLLIGFGLCNGLNDAVLKTNGPRLPDNKDRKYEMEMFEQKEQEKRNTVATLSNYLK